MTSVAGVVHAQDRPLCASNNKENMTSRFIEFMSLISYLNY